MTIGASRRTFTTWALSLTSVLGLARPAFAQITIVDAGTDQPVSPAQPPAAPTIPFRLAPAAKSSPFGDGGAALQVHAARVAALSNLSISLTAACAPGSPDVDKPLLERAAIRALALRRGLAEIEQREKQLRQENAQRPNDGRIRAELASLVQNKQRLLEAATRDVSGKLGDAVRSIGALRSSVCSELCSRGDKAATAVDLCSFAEPALANAAVIADEESVRALATYLNHRFDGLRMVLPSKQTLSLTEVALAEPGIAPIFAVADKAKRIFDEAHTGLDVAAFTLGTLEIGLKALASVIVDRAKRESVLWFTRRLHEDVCGGPNPSIAAGYGEVRSFWFPTTCTLAGGSVKFMQYGDADFLRTLRGAIAADVSSWQATALGLSLGAGFWADQNIDESLFSCAPETTELPLCAAENPDYVACANRRKFRAACSAVRDVRLSGAKLATNISSGANASLAMYNFAADVDRINTQIGAKPSERHFFSDRLELLACAAAIPYVFQEYGDLVRQTQPGKIDESKALLLAALTHSPACFSLVGRGFSRQACGGFSETAAGTVESICPPVDAGKTLDARVQPILALQAAGKLEKLTTILRWSRFIESPAADLSTRWYAVVDAFRAYRQAAEDMAKSPPNVTVSAVPTDVSGIAKADKPAEVVEAVGAFAENAARLAERLPKLRVSRASLVQARASLDLAMAFLEAAQRSLETNLGTGSKSPMFGAWYEQDKPIPEAELNFAARALFPGLVTSTGLSPVELRKVFGQTRADLRRLSESIETMEAVFAEDWGRVVARASAGMRVDIERSCASIQCKEACARDEGACSVVGKFAQYGGLFATLAFESNPDRVAAAMDAAASPGGGYRRKNVPGAMTISLGSFAGLSGGAEFRFGTYGGRVENGSIPYLAAPTLTLPVGIDFARGFGTHNLGVFVSAIDPAAYLQYDAAAGARLPGPQIVTVLAPGAWLHTSILDSPFVLSLYGVFRPGLRADSAAFSIPGAHALQFGVSASVDVTLFDLFTSTASVRKE
jgi:hypothetical protein